MTRTQPAAGLAVTVLAAAVLAAVLAACSATDPPSEATPTPEHTASVTASPTATPTPTPTPSPSPSYPDDGVLPDSAGDDPAHAIEEIVKFRWHLFEVPNPTKVGLIYAKQCTCYEDLRDDLERLAARDWRLEGDEPDIDDVEVVSREFSLAVVRYTVTFPASRVLDADGETVHAEEGSEPERFEADLLKDGPRWRVQVIREPAG